MYLIGRYLRRLKSYVRNEARPKGCIAKAYIAQKCVHFCSRYLDGAETRLNRYGKNYEGDLQRLNKSKFKIFLQVEKLLHEKKYVELNIVEQKQFSKIVMKF